MSDTVPAHLNVEQPALEAVVSGEADAGGHEGVGGVLAAEEGLEQLLARVPLRDDGAQHRHPVPPPGRHPAHCNTQPPSQPLHSMHKWKLSIILTFLACLQA